MPIHYILNGNCHLSRAEYKICKLIKFKMLMQWLLIRTEYIHLVIRSPYHARLDKELYFNQQVSERHYKPSIDREREREILLIDYFFPTDIFIIEDYFCSRFARS